MSIVTFLRLVELVLSSGRRILARPALATCWGILVALGRALTVDQRGAIPDRASRRLRPM